MLFCFHSYFYCITHNMPTSFLADTQENILLNQYWYSQHTINHIIKEIVSVNAPHSNIAFISTPSLYFNITNQNTQFNCYLFDYDKTLSERITDPTKFVLYDYADLSTVPTALYNTFDYVVIDPPFVTDIVWQKYTDAVKLLVKTGSRTIQSDNSYKHHTIQQHTVGRSFIDTAQHIHSIDNKHNHADTGINVPNGKILLSTIPENADMLYNMLNVRLTCFRPSIPNLIYQYSLYTNYQSILLNQLNTEIDCDVHDMPDQYKQQQIHIQPRISSLGSNENLVTADELQQKYSNTDKNDNTIFHTSKKQCVLT